MVQLNNLVICEDVLHPWIHGSVRPPTPSIAAASLEVANLCSLTPGHSCVRERYKERTSSTILKRAAQGERDTERRERFTPHGNSSFLYTLRAINLEAILIPGSQYILQNIL